MNSMSSQAAKALSQATALLVTAGAGMGVDSGLPDFRGDQGFWKAYPQYQPLGLTFVDAANPAQFVQDPAFGWGFYGHRLNLYRQTQPHAGFSLILEWVQRYHLDLFVVTSNVDGQFQKAGFNPDQIYEIHGSIHHLQCLHNCKKEIWLNQAEVFVDLKQMRAKNPPICHHCASVARPNILMFGDSTWQSERSDQQGQNLHKFLDKHRVSNRVVLEIGAGLAVPTIRHFSEQQGQAGARVIRINPRDWAVAPPHFSIPLGGLEGLKELHQYL